MTAATVYQAPNPCQMLCTSHLRDCFCVRLGRVSSVFQMRRLNHKETRALSCDDWGLFVKARSHMGPQEVNESVHWRDTGASANSRGWEGPGSQQEAGLVPARQATCTHVLFLFLSGLEPNKAGHPGGRDRAPPPKTLTRAALLGLTKIPHPSCQTGPERVWLTL